MKQFDVERPIPSQPLDDNMPKENNDDNITTATEDSYESPDSEEFQQPSSPEGQSTISSRCSVGGSPRLTQRDVCSAGFGSWCDDSSTEDEDDESAASFDSNDNIVVDFSSLSNSETFTSFYYSCRTAVEEEAGNLVGRSDEEDEEKIRISYQRCHDEELFMDNLRRRKLRFSDKPRVKEFEPAPFSCHNDMYYSCHQLQKMMDAYRAGREFELEE